MTKQLTATLYDVIAINIKTGRKRIMASGMSKDDANTYVRMAVIRRGIDEEFFGAVPTGIVHDV